MNIDHLEIRLSRAASLPLLPGVVTEVLSLPEDSPGGVRDYERIIQRDAALAAKILRTSNSAYYGGAGDVTDLNQAIARLGIGATRATCIAAGFYSSLNFRNIHKRFSISNYWQHSLGVACTSKLLAMLTKQSVPEQAFLAGLLHDIGKLAFCMFLPVQATQVYDLMENQHITQYEAEQSILEFTHQEIGKRVSSRWQIPSMYHKPVSQHHNPMDFGEPDSLTVIVHIADYLTHAAGISSIPTECPPELNPLVEMHLGMAEEQYQPIQAAVAMEVAKISQQMGV